MAWIDNNAQGLAEAPSQPGNASRPNLSQQVAVLLRRLQPPVEHDRRQGTRTPIPLLFHLAPLPGDVPDELAQEMVVVGKDISERGIGFYHQRPIPYRRGVLSIDLPGDGPIRLEVDLLWCRFTSLGWYESGGRLLKLSSDGPLSRAG